ncbi:hypothetical protein B0F90DRAFT_1669320 [Multifurca ochricompacta]|uniref:Fungal-type protein kinase domain-containing protein n=1 Tax=Multifurca ochricompacta TaxID=376703 RepID=A0AAD4M0U3_9AGAM|nr:hypothetical protein B0F90DRAFT_1669320 [Multifurca ochricompacta]
MPNPSTPPNSNDPHPGKTLSETTPLKKDLPGSETHSSLPYLKASERYKNMTFDASEKFVGPMPIDKFLSEFIQAIDASGLCPNLKFVNTTTSQKGPYRLKPDISVYSGNGIGPDNPNSLDWRAVDLWIENKGERSDIFRTHAEMKKAEEHVESHIRWTNSAYKICGQLLAYASALHRSQFRFFSFSVIIFSESARLLRWDRSGVIYTDAFKWATQPDTLFEFFWRFNFLSDVDRGYDTTVTPVPDDDAEVALSKLKTHQGLGGITKTDLHKFLVRDDINGELRSCITPGAVWYTEALFGRSTFGYIAYDDFWRTDIPGIQKEGDVYRELHDAQVPNIAKFGRAGDVPLSPEHTDVASFTTQRTRTQDYVKRPGGEHDGVLVNHLTLLHTKELKYCIGCERGNILISDEGCGILIDWDLCKRVRKGVEEKARQHSRTGTWQFISIWRLLEPSLRRHEICDDLESFFWVLVYQIAKCRSPGKTDTSMAMQLVFDGHSVVGSDNLVRGGVGKFYFLRGSHILPDTIEWLAATPCSDIVEELRTLFCDLYLHVVPEYDGFKARKQEILAKQEKQPRVQDARKKLSSSDWVLSIFDKHLATRWEVDDDGSLCKDEFRLDSSASRNRRKRKASDGDDNRTTDERRKGHFPPSSKKEKMAVPVIQGSRGSAATGSSKALSRRS